MYGTDYAYAQTRIQGTIVRLLDGTPVYVLSVGNGPCSVLDIRHGLRNFDEAVNVDLDDLDLRPVNLGYVNDPVDGHTSINAEYYIRIPKRRDWKQGLRGENCKGSGHGWRHLSMKSLRKTILGDFPSFNQALAKAKKHGIIVAWHRHWATDGHTVYYRNNESVGSVEGKSVSLEPRNKYLTEALEDSFK